MVQPTRAVAGFWPQTQTATVRNYVSGSNARGSSHSCRLCACGMCETTGLLISTRPSAFPKRATDITENRGASLEDRKHQGGGRQRTRNEHGHELKFMDSTKSKVLIRPGRPISKRTHAGRPQVAMTGWLEQAYGATEGTV